jgi:uncharacterized membrane protein
MPGLAPFHPILVHFVIALLVAGVLFRLVSLTGRAKFTGPSASTLLLLGAFLTLPAVKSGEDAHGPAERVPGARQAVMEHEEWGERTRNLFLGIATLELLALALAKSRHQQKILALSALAGLLGLFAVYETGQHGGELVYSYAGGVGTRTGQAEDVERLFLAGLYHQAMQDRSEGRSQSAAHLIEEMDRRFPGNLEVQLLRAESLMEDQSDGEGALAVLGGMTLPRGDRRLLLRQRALTADALVLLGRADEARSILEDLAEEFPTSQTVRSRLERFEGIP